MALSASSLFHFTNSLDSIIGILSSKFRITYCKESYHLGSEFYSHYYPMISFCDVPLNLAHNHLKSYGNYALGMSKQWGIKNKLNPVLYIQKDSNLALDMKSQTDSLLAVINNMEKFVNYLKQEVKGTSVKVNAATALYKKKDFEALRNRMPELQLEILRNDKQLAGISEQKEQYKRLVENLFEGMLGCVKNYEGTLERRGKVSNKYRFYDEREWRYVPRRQDGKPVLISEEEYRKYRGKSQLKPFFGDDGLSFSASDIKYIIVRRQSEVPKVLAAVKNMPGLIKRPEYLSMLATKILTVQQLKSDF